MEDGPILPYGYHTRWMPYPIATLLPIGTPHSLVSYGYLVGTL
jgi:hypothetical protein